jgi:hypothetical protein
VNYATVIANRKMQMRHSRRLTVAIQNSSRWVTKHQRPVQKPGRNIHSAGLLQQVEIHHYLANFKGLSQSNYSLPVFAVKPATSKCLDLFVEEQHIADQRPETKLFSPLIAAYLCT